MAGERPTTDLVLLGLRAAGKTTIGRLVAERLRAEFIDLDDVVRAQLDGLTIAEFFQRQGEPAFRAIEAQELEHLLASHDGSQHRVIALGGGTPTAPGAADLLRQAQSTGRAKLIYLHAPPSALRQRLTTDDPNRPAILGRDAIDEIGQLYAARDPIYRALADEVIATDDASDFEDAERIADRISTT